jgi:hypothetical protein
MPTILVPGVLYVSEEFGTAAHLCACGCGAKIRTPLSPTEWSVEETNGGPTLRPSVGNWQEPCHSHYLISRGETRWCARWTREEISEGRREEEARRQTYYAGRTRFGVMRRFWRGLKGGFKGLLPR